MENQSNNLMRHAAARAGEEFKLDPADVIDYLRERSAEMAGDASRALAKRVTRSIRQVRREASTAYRLRLSTDEALALTSCSSHVERWRRFAEASIVSPDVVEEEIARAKAAGPVLPCGDGAFRANGGVQ